MNRAHQPHKDENPLGGGLSSAATKLHDLDCGTNEAIDKIVKHLQQAFAEHGHRLTRTVNHDGTVSLFAGCGMYERELPNLDAARRFLEQIGGAHE